MNLKQIKARELAKIKELAKVVKTMPRENSMNTTRGNQSALRDKLITKKVKELKKNINRPITPNTCSGTSYQCDITGSGKTPIKDVNTYPCDYDYLGTPIRDASLSGRSFALPILHNWQNSSNETKYTKSSLRDTIGFENFQ